MGVQQKATGRASSIPAGLAMGAAVSILTTAVICLIGGWMIGSEMISQEQIGYCSLTALLASAVMGSTAAWKRIKRKRLMVCLTSGGIYFLILAGITIVFFDGRFEGLGVTFLTILVGVVIPVLLTNRDAKGRTGKWRKKTYR